MTGIKPDKMYKSIPLTSGILPYLCGHHMAHWSKIDSFRSWQVLPRDKRECVLALQRSYELVVGMTGGFPKIWGSGHGGRMIYKGTCTRRSWFYC